MRTLYGLFSSRQWGVIVASGILLALSSSLMFLFGVFIKPLESEFGWSRSATSFGYSIYMAMIFFSAIPMGGLSDRYGTRPIVIVGALVTGLGIVLGAGIQNLWHYYLLIGLLSGIGRSGFTVPVFAFIQRAFSSQNRGLATGLAGSGSGVGIILFPLLTGYLVANHGWRMAYVVMGAMVLILSVPSTAVFRPVGKEERERTIPRSGGHTSTATHREAAPLPESEKGMSDIIKRRSFWSILGSHTSDCICHSVIIVHLVPFAIETGVPDLQAATLMTALGVGTFIGRIGGGVLSDRWFGGKWALFTSLVSQTTAVPLLLFFPTLPVMYVVAFMVGLGLGGHGTLYPVVTREYYGPKRVGLLLGTFTTGASAGMAAGGFLGGVFYDLTGDYTFSFLFSFTLGVISLLLVWIYPNRQFLPAAVSETAASESAQPAA